MASNKAAKQPERRRFEEKERKVWSEDERKQYLQMREKIAPFVRDITTPPPKAEENKSEDLMTKLFGK